MNVRGAYGVASTAKYRAHETLFTVAAILEESLARVQLQDSDLSMQQLISS